MNAYKYFLVPILIALSISTFYILKSPADLTSDALEYDKLADSILLNQYSIDGKPSMQREPGYPFFRAEVKSITQNPNAILWIQALLYLLTVYFVGLISYRIDPERGAWGVFGAGLSYGLAFYTSKNLSEILVSFLLTSIALLIVYAIKRPSFKYWITISVLSGALLLTRYTYILIPLVAFLLLYISEVKTNISPRVSLRNIMLSCLIVFSIVAPWVYRNYKLFNEINVAGRSGGILYARAVQANNEWRSIPDSLLSTLVGRGILYTVYPENRSVWLEQWGDWWRSESLIKEMWGTEPVEIDKRRKEKAFEFILGNTTNFIKFSLWSIINEIRLLQLPNPVLEAKGSPLEGTYGQLAQNARLSTLQLLLLLLAHLIQFAWFTLIILSTYLGFKKYGYRYIPGIFLLCLILPHMIADNIARYSVPLHPLILSGIFMTTLFPIYKAAQNKLKTWKNRPL